MARKKLVSVSGRSDGIVLEDVTKLASNGKKQAGARGLAVTGNNGSATVGKFGLAAVSGDGNAIGGEWGVAFAGCGKNGTVVNDPLTQAKSVATGGANTVCVVNKYGKAESGDGGVSVALQYGAANSGKNGVSIAGVSGVARAGNQGIAITRWRSKASAGEEGIVILGFREGENANLPIRFRIGIIGKKEDFDIKVVFDLKPNQLYMLDKDHEIVEVPSVRRRRVTSKLTAKLKSA